MRLKEDKFYLKVRKNGKEKEAIVKAHSIQNVLNSFRQHNVAIVEHFQVSDDIYTVEEALESVQRISSTVH